MFDRSALQDFLSKIPPFSNLPEAAIISIAQSSTLKTIPAKEFIFLEGEAGSAGYIVYSGRIAMIKTSPNGREMINELLPAGELFGAVAFIDDRPYPLTARAQCESAVICIPRTIVRELGSKHPAIFQDLLKVVSTRLQSAHNVSRAIAHDKVEVRIAATLIAFISKIDLIQAEGIEIGRQELADIVGTTIETASRVCKQFEKQGIIDASIVGKVLIKDLTVLEEIALA